MKWKNKINQRKVNKTLEKIKKRGIIIDINIKNNNKDTANNKIS